MIRTTELTKRYGETLALDRLSLEVPVGAVFGLLGPNGAGKTTLLRLVMGFAFPNGGQIDRGGLSPAHIGYLPERAIYPFRFTIHDYLTTIGRLSGLRGPLLRQAVEQLLGQFGLGEIAGRRLGACSRGMLQRLGLAQALVGDPSLVLLDEPAMGLDPAAQKFMREQITALHRSSKTVILSSHHLDEVTRVCSHIAVLQEGRLVQSGPLETILAPRPHVTITTSPISTDLADRLQALAPEIAVADRQVNLDGKAVAHKAEVLRLLLNAEVDIQQLSEQHTSLEEIYLEATGG
jgi:ABC-2 type transport system ATP-binding protein